MALNEDDKKFIKKTVNDAVDKKTTSFEKAASNDKSSRLKAQIEERKERQEYIKQLKELQSNGETTMAQKFELMKEEINSKISKDIKNTVTDTINTVGKGARTVSRGANKAVSGVDGILTRMANIDPVLAALYAGTKGVSKDLWNIGAGGLQALVGGAQMAWGGAKAVGGLVGSTMNSMRNLYLRRKRQKQETPQQDIELDTPIPVSQNEEQQTETETEIQLPSLFPQKEEGSKSLIEMQNKIKDIHQAVVKEEKKNKESQLKSLAGLQKTMESINGVMTVLKAKQALIVTGVVLGVTALIGLAAWFKGGGFQKLLNGTINNKLKEMAPNLNSESKIQAEDNLDAQINLLKTNAEDMQNAEVSKIDGLYDKGGKEKAWKKQIDSTTKSINLKNTLTTPNSGIAYTTRTIGNKKQGKTGDFRVPVDCTIFESGMEGFGENATWWIKLIRDYEKTDNNRGWSRAPVIVVDNIAKIHVKINEKIPANRKIATVNYPYHVYGDYDAFIKKDGKSYQDAMFNDEAIQGMAKQYNETQDSVYKVAGGVDHHIDKELDTKVGNRKEADVEYIKKRINGGQRFEGMSEDKMLVKDTPNQEQTTPGELQDGFDQATAPDKPVKGIPTGGAASITSENEQKVQTQNEQLKEATKQQPTEDKGYVGEKPDLGKTQINLQEPGTNGQDIWSNMPTHMDYGLMARQQRNNSIL